MSRPFRLEAGPEPAQVTAARRRIFALALLGAVIAGAAAGVISTRPLP